MKKSLIALAVLAASGVASAQSSVTVYGKVDIGAARSIGSSITELKQATASRLGFKGTEDIGGGLKANFTLEHRFLPDTGAVANANSFFTGRSLVGLEGGFGRIDMGRDYAVAFFTALAGDVFGYDGIAANTAIAGSDGNQTVRFDNVITYTAPTLGGLGLSASYALKETAAKNATSLRAVYAAGPVSIQGATERGNDGRKYNAVFGSYNAGVATVSALINKGEKANGVDTDGMLFGLTVPMGALTLKASYGKLEVNNVDTVSQLGLGMRYALSKRTDIYSSYARNSKRTTDKSGFELGLQHNF